MDYKSVNTAELETLLARLQTKLEDVEETINFNLPHISAHIGGREGRKDEESLGQLKENIAIINEVLSKRT